VEGRLPEFSDFGDPPGPHFNPLPMSKLLNEFNEYRSRMNERILSEDHAVIKRFFGVDTLTYRDGALSEKTKEMLGLCASMVLRCDDCVRYHIERCHRLEVTRAEFFDLFSVALVVGGSIVVPHLRRAVEFLDELESDQADRMA
jgi:AhpD family alkylhydroperoxidase